MAIIKRYFIKLITDSCEVMTIRIKKYGRIDKHNPKTIKKRKGENRNEIQILAPTIRGRKGEYHQLLQDFYLLIFSTNTYHWETNLYQMDF